MRIRLRSGLVLLNLLVVIVIATIIFLPSNVLRIMVGLPFVLFFPGYVLLLALFPRKGMRGAERATLSFGFSIVMVSLIGFALNYTPWGITLESVVFSITSFIFAMSVIAWIRRKGLEEQKRFTVEFQLKVPRWSGGKWDMVLSGVLVISVLILLGALSYAVAKPKTGEKFTEFYILGPGGVASDYPGELVIGDVAKVTVGITNQEDRAVDYRVEIKLAGTQIGELGPVMLEHGQGWEQEVDIIPVTIGENQKVEFLLFKEGKEKPSNLTHFWLDVKEKT